MTNPAVEALKPCPFCGGEVTWLDWHGVTIRHKSDLAGMKCVEVGDRWARKEDAIEAWNRRAQAEQTPVAGLFANREDIYEAIRYSELVSDDVASELADVLERRSPPPSGANPPGREAGRIISEELAKELELRLHGGTKDRYLDSVTRRLLQALRASPSFPKEGE